MKWYFNETDHDKNWIVGWHRRYKWFDVFRFLIQGSWARWQRAKRAKRALLNHFSEVWSSLRAHSWCNRGIQQLGSNYFWLLQSSDSFAWQSYSNSIVLNLYPTIYYLLQRPAEYTAFFDERLRDGKSEKFRNSENCVCILQSKQTLSWKFQVCQKRPRFFNSHLHKSVSFN